MLSDDRQTGDVIFEQYEDVRLSGVCNMLDRGCVYQVANDMGYDELASIVRSAKRYGRLLMGIAVWQSREEMLRRFKENV